MSIQVIKTCVREFGKLNVSIVSCNSRNWDLEIGIRETEV
jgi:hypothetical protein